ncbi:hypothetical protein [Streptomyces sp. CAU 1734]|uniref:hypothetical protein n=1 Tax=Streptomyces sp. CAU 1734 TaxID=3140360 RepID=UPI0032607F0C
MGAGPALRLAHTAVLTAVCVVVSGLGHDLSSGIPPSVAGYALALPPVCAVAWRLTRRERSARVVAAVLAAEQLALHVLFGVASHRTTPSFGHHGMHAEPAPPPRPAGGAGPLDVLSDGSAMSWAMAAAHLLAGGVCGWWVWCGERALVRAGRALRLMAPAADASWRRLLRTAARLVRRARAAAAGSCAGRPAVPVPHGHGAPVRLPAPLAILRALTRRGPPLLPS